MLRGTLIKKDIHHLIIFWQTNFVHGVYGIIVLISFYEKTLRDCRSKFVKK